MSAIEATEMSNGQADYISLVKRGANRIGFRVLKSEDQQEHPMLTLNSLPALARALKGEKPQPKGPVVVGIATKAEGAQLEAVKKSLEANGYAIDKMEAQEDGTQLFRQSDEPLEGTSLVRLSENAVLVMKGFKPYSEDVTSDFLANVKANGFYNSIYSANEAFRSSLYEILYDAESPSAAGVAVKKLLGDFDSYVMGLVNDLPVKAFKMDADIALALKAEPVAEEQKEDDKPADDKPAEEPKPAEAPADAPVQPIADAPKEEAKPDEPKADEPKPADAPAEEQKPEEDQQAKVLKLLTALSDKITAISDAQEEQAKTLKSVSSAQDSLTQTVDEVARKSDSALKAVKGTVLGSPPAEDMPDNSEPSKVAKTDADPRTGCFDTAFLNR